MKIDGDVSSNEPPKMRFSIFCEGFTVSLNAERTGNGVYEINVPILEGVAHAGEYEAHVEVFIDGKHFVPLKETVRFKQEVKPTVKIANKTVEELKESEIKITAKPVIIKKTDKIISA